LLFLVRADDRRLGGPAVADDAHVPALLGCSFHASTRKSSPAPKRVATESSFLMGVLPQRKPHGSHSEWRHPAEGVTNDDYSSD